MFTAATAVAVGPVWWQFGRRNLSTDAILGRWELLGHTDQYVFSEDGMVRGFQNNEELPESGHWKIEGNMITIEVKGTSIWLRYRVVGPNYIKQDLWFDGIEEHEIDFKPWVRISKV